MSDTFPSLVSTDWLADHLADDDLVVIDATRHLPAANRDAAREYETGHIPGARFFDLESLVDTASSVPAALPTAEQLAKRLASLGIGAGDRIVIYDDSEVKTSARAWFVLRASGFDDAAILDGGIAKWRDEGREIKSGGAVVEEVAGPDLHPPADVATKAGILAHLDTQSAQIVDARSADRVFGAGEDPVHGGANGRIPGSLNVPFGDLFAQDGTFKAPDDLRAVFERAGVDLTRPVITTCGSGVTASVVLFALHLIGIDDVRLYDGSWLEWSADPATPKAQGPA